MKDYIARMQADESERMLLRVKYALSQIELDECADIDILFDKVTDRMVTSICLRIPTEAALLAKNKELQQRVRDLETHSDNAEARLLVAYQALEHIAHNKYLTTHQRHTKAVEALAEIDRIKAAQDAMPTPALHTVWHHGGKQDDGWHVEYSGSPYAAHLRFEMLHDAITRGGEGGGAVVLERGLYPFHPATCTISMAVKNGAGLGMYCWWPKAEVALP